MSKEKTIWQYKPWWCQPWSILLTGIILITGSWLISKLIWLTVLVAIPVSIWMIFFLLIYPRFVKESGILEQMESQSQT
ncbi:DUF6737 family protein [Calothrix sp. 336/3]|uniref:DUF6737 family protein n=1 Tax=Calothrix sp. 336/3 TaxID=1337936 RepID=UPI0004E31CF2|nr:DUF6737 family protein [Calothrix sp. 336/3]AKG24790.1 hypothetical protein IJ00_22055 [Calothrix sp. 336/3]